MGILRERGAVAFFIDQAILGQRHAAKTRLMRIDRVRINGDHLKASPSAMASTSATLLMLASRNRPSATERVRTIAVAMDEQQATISQIEGNVGHLKTIALSNSSAAEEITATMVQLSKLSNDTRQRLAAFKTE